ncbi:hypothetical protein CR513_35550, partial [Mucuna pruriens]
MEVAICFGVIIRNFGAGVLFVLKLLQNTSLAHHSILLEILIILVLNHLLLTTILVVSLVPPSYNALRTSLLQQEKSHIERLLQPIKAFYIVGVILVGHRWTNAQRRPLMNFMNAVDSSKENRDKDYLANLIKDCPQNVVQLIVVNAEFHHVFWTSHVVHTDHTSTLALENMCNWEY